MNYGTGEDVPAFGPGVVMSLGEREACSGAARPQFEAHAPPTNMGTGSCVVLAKYGGCPNGACSLARNA